MVKVADFLKCLKNHKINYICGVPDSVLSPLISYLNKKNKHFTHRVTVNEGGAIGLASGYFLAKKKIPLIYFQNSGLGNALNPLTSLADETVYSFPMIMLIGHRGAPSIPDEPQHNKMGPELFKILKAAKYKYFKLNKKNYKNYISKALKFAKKKSCPVAIVVDNTFFEKNKNKEKKINKKNFKRYECIKHIVKNKLFSKHLFIASTGNVGRELYSINKTQKKHNQSFYNIGAMGHANQIGLEIALSSKKNVVIFDGDGAVQMHMGNLILIGKFKKRILHIIFSNKLHESTGNHALASDNVDYASILKGCKYDQIKVINNFNGFKKALSRPIEKLTALVVNVDPGTINNLPRPKETPKQLKKIFKVN